MYLFMAVLGVSCSKGDLSRQDTWGSCLLVACRLSSCSTQAYLPCGMWDPSSQTRHPTHVPCIGRQILNHRTTREVPYP